LEGILHILGGPTLVDRQINQNKHEKTFISMADQKDKQQNKATEKPTVEQTVEQSDMKVMISQFYENFMDLLKALTNSQNVQMEMAKLHGYVRGCCGALCDTPLDNQFKFMEDFSKQLYDMKEMIEDP
jgi:hypothetical protein